MIARGVLSLFLVVLISVLVFPRAGLTERQLVTEAVGEKWSGDFDEMVKRRQIRLLVPYSKTFYFLDGAHQRGLSYELSRQFDAFVNKKLGKKTRRVRVVVVPTSRDRLLPALAEGVGDIAVGNLTITAERKQVTDFSNPLLAGVSEVIVTRKGTPLIKSAEDLSGQEIHVRKSSSYYQSLQELNAKLRKAGKPEVKIVLADEYFEDEDLLEMLNVGLMPMTVIDSHKGEFWAQIFTDLTLHKDATLRTDAEIAWAFRKHSPKLRKVVNEFVRSHKKGTRTGNVLFNRYLKNTKWVRNPLEGDDLKRFEDTLQLFEKYSKQYGFDWLMVGALAYQESRIQQNKRSHAGAIGVMQLLPSTAADKNVGIRNIQKLENNIHAGTKYLRFLRDRYFEKEPMDDVNKMLFAFASYNAGPRRVAGLRSEARKKGLDPNVWFRNVELVAARRIGRETVQYVSNIYKYYVAYRLIVDRLDLLDRVKAQRSK